jgi:hypothetical protein
MIASLGAAATDAHAAAVGDIMARLRRDLTAL